MKKFDSGINYFLLDQTEIRNQIANISSYVFGKSENEIYKQLSEMKIVPFGAHVLSNIGYQKTYWADIHNMFSVRNKRIYDEVITIFHAFFESKVTNVVLFENFGTLILTDSCLSCFSSGDIDFSADFVNKSKIELALCSIGYKITYRRGVSDEIMTTFVKEGIIANSPFFVNFEWKPIARNYIMNMSKLEKRLEYLRHHFFSELEGGIRVLSTNALLYFNYLHVSIGHYFSTSPGIRLYVDIDKILRKMNDIDKNIILDWATHDEQLIRIYVASTIASDILGSDNIFSQADFSITTLRWGNRILRYLWHDKKQTYVTRESLFSQVLIDSMSEGMSLIKYLCKRTFSNKRSIRS